MSHYSLSASRLIQKESYMNWKSTAFVFILFLKPFMSISQELITYDFEAAKTGKAFSEALPFDMPFDIKFTNIGNRIDSIKLIIRDISNIEKIKRQLKREKKPNGTPKYQQITESLIFNHPSSFPANTYSNQVQSGADLIISVVIPLYPNRNYRFEVQTKESGPLTNKEKEDLLKKLKLPGALEGITNKMLKAILEQPVSTTPDQLLNETFDRTLPKIIQNKISSIDQSYSLINLDVDQFIILKQEFGNVFSEFDNLIFEIKKLESHLKEEELPLQIFDSDEIVKKIQDDQEILELLKVKHSDANDKGLTTSFDDHRFDKRLSQLKTNIEVFEKQYEDQLKLIVDRVMVANQIARTYHSDIVQNAGLYFTNDIGAGFATGIDRFFTMLGAANVYLRPINENVPLKQYKRFEDWMLTRSSLLIGLTVTGDIEASGVREGIIDAQALLLGAGFRVLPWLKVNTGSLIYNKINPNPLVSTKTTRSDLFFSVTISAALQPTITRNITPKTTND